MLIRYVDFKCFTPWFNTITERVKFVIKNTQIQNEYKYFLFYYLLDAVRVIRGLHRSILST